MENPKWTDNIFLAAVGLVIFGVIVGIGADVLDDIHATVRDTTTNTDGKDSWTGSNVTAKTLTYRSDTVPQLYSSLTIVNVTGNIALNTTMYTFDTAAGTVVLTAKGNASWGGANLNLTYSYDIYTGYSSDVVRNSSESVSELADWAPTIALVLAAGLIVSIVGGFIFGRRE